MQNRNARLYLSALLSLVVAVGTSWASLSFSYFFRRDLSYMSSMAKTILPIYFSLSFVLFFIYAKVLEKPFRTTGRIDAGEDPGREERIAARTGFQAFNRFLNIIALVCFVIVPIAFAALR